MEQGFVDLIKDVGFPIAVSLFFMWRMDKTIKENTEMIRKMVEMFNDIANKRSK